MSVRADGGAECDGCGYDCQNGGLQYCVIVLDEAPVSEGGMRKFHFCRAHEGDNGRTVKGCGEKLLGAKVLAHYEAKHEGETQADGTDTAGGAAPLDRATRYPGYVTAAGADDGGAA